MKEPHLSQVGELKTSETIAHFVDGERTVLTSERRSSVYNPASGRVIGEVALASTTDVAKVVASAAEAFKAWEKTPPHVRARVLFRYRVFPSHRQTFRGEYQAFSQAPVARMNDGLSLPDNRRSPVLCLHGQPMMHATSRHVSGRSSP